MKFSFDARSDDELTLIEGDIVSVLGRADYKGWWKGQLENKVGVFPANYVELIEEKDTAREEKDHNHSGLL